MPTRIVRIDQSHIAELLRIAEETNLNRWAAEGYIAELSNQNAIMLRMASDENATLGFVVGRVVAAADSETDVDAEIYNIGVAENEQRRGFGQQLLDAFSSVCREKFVRHIWLEVRESNIRAQHFYRKNAFTTISTRPNFYSDPSENGILMRRSLKADGTHK